MKPIPVSERAQQALVGMAYVETLARNHCHGEVTLTADDLKDWRDAFVAELGSLHRRIQGAPKHEVIADTDRGRVLRRTNGGIEVWTWAGWSDYSTGRCRILPDAPANVAFAKREIGLTT